MPLQHKRSSTADKYLRSTVLQQHVSVPEHNDALERSVMDCHPQMLGREERQEKSFIYRKREVHVVLRGSFKVKEPAEAKEARGVEEREVISRARQELFFFVIIIFLIFPFFFSSFSSLVGPSRKIFVRVYE